MPESPVREGGCACGAIRYRADGPAFNATLCHCTDCRRISGAPVVAWFSLHPDGFAITRGEARIFRSSPKVGRGFCPTCGTPLTYSHDDCPGEIDITTCSLDDPSSVPPCDHVWTDSDVGWSHADLPRYPRSR